VLPLNKYNNDGLGMFVISYNMPFEALYHGMFLLKLCLNLILWVFPCK
jgi:hypothetical protein